MIDKNLQSVTEAAQAIEKQLVENELPAKQVVGLTKQLMEYINAANLLQQIKAAQKPLPKQESRIIRM